MTASATPRSARSALWPASVRALATPLLIATLVVILIVAALVTTPPPEPIPYDLDSSHPGGLLALRLWLAELGYEVRRADGLRFDLPEQAAMMFVYPNQLSYTAAEAAALKAWVAEGGALVLVGPDDEDQALIEAFGVRIADDASYGSAQVQVQPLLPEGRRVYAREWFASAATLDLRAAPQAVPVLVLGATDDAPDVLAAQAAHKAVAAVQRVGDGVVWHLAPGVDLTNLNLRDYDQGELLPALLRTAAARSVVVFDTYHLYGFSRVGEQIATLQDWLYRTPAGWATLFALLVTGSHLLLQGRRLGPPLVTVAQTRGREAAEYVQAMAQLHRRAHTHTELARHHHSRLKAGLARRRAVLPDLPDDEFLRALAHASPPLNEAQVSAVRTTLAGLTARPQEPQLVELAAQVDRLLKTIL